MNWKNIIIFIMGFIVGLLGVLVWNNMKTNNTPVIDNPSTSINEQQDNNQDTNIKVIEGELTGFADSRTIEIVTQDGPVSCRVYDDNIILELEKLIDKNIKLEVKCNENTKVNIVTKIL